LFACFPDVLLFFVIPPDIAIRFPATTIIPAILFVRFKAYVISPIGIFPTLLFAPILSNISAFI